MTVGSSVGARVETLEVNEQQQAQNEEQKSEESAPVSSKIARRLSLNSVLEDEEAYENLDLKQLDLGIRWKAMEQ